MHKVRVDGDPVGQYDRLLSVFITRQGRAREH
jgi:hypothetical protein